MADYFVWDDADDNPNAVRIFRKKQLRPTHLTHQLNVPEEVLQKYPIYGAPHSNSRAFTSFDRHGNAWPFHLSVRRAIPYSKPYFTKSDWHPFVVAKGLREGDEVHFYTLKNNPGAGIQVRAYRREPGTGNWRDVEDFLL